MQWKGGGGGRGGGRGGGNGQAAKSLEGIQFVRPRAPYPGQPPRPSGTPMGGGGGAPRFGQPAVTPSGNAYRMPGTVILNKPSTPTPPTARPNIAEPVLSKEEYFTLWKKETDPDLQKLRKLAYETLNLKSERPNACDRIHSAANRVPIRTEFNTEPVRGAKGNRAFVCFVSIEGISIASGQGAKIKDAKLDAYEIALQKVYEPHLRIVQSDPETRYLQGSREPFTKPPPPTSAIPLARNKAPQYGQIKESNQREAGMKRRHNEFKPVEDFVIVEPKFPIPDCTSAHTLRRSADFNHMLLEHEYFFKGELSVRCVLKIENHVLAEATGTSRQIAKNQASIYALEKLKKICWIIKTKQPVDAEEGSRISKEEMLNELVEHSEVIGEDNVGNKMLRKMGWSGGGMGKDGSGIEEPVSLKSVMNREGLGLGTQKGISAEFRTKVTEVIEDYAISGSQEDLVFSSDFRVEERQVIHDLCRRFNLKSKSRGKGNNRYLCVRRKRTANELFDFLMAVGGQTHRYELVPPNKDGLPGSEANVPQGNLSFSESDQDLKNMSSGSEGFNDQQDCSERRRFGGSMSSPDSYGQRPGDSYQNFHREGDMGDSFKRKPNSLDPKMSNNVDGAWQGPSMAGNVGMGRPNFQNNSMNSGQNVGRHFEMENQKFGSGTYLGMGAGDGYGLGFVGPRGMMGQNAGDHSGLEEKYVGQWATNVRKEPYVEQDVMRWASNASTTDTMNNGMEIKSELGNGTMGQDVGSSFVGAQAQGVDTDDACSTSSGSSDRGNGRPGLLATPGMRSRPNRGNFQGYGNRGFLPTPQGYGQNMTWQNNPTPFYQQGRGGYSGYPYGNQNARGWYGRQW